MSRHVGVHRFGDDGGDAVREDVEEIVLAVLDHGVAADVHPGPAFGGALQAIFVAHAVTSRARERRASAGVLCACGA